MYGFIFSIALSLCWIRSENKIASYYDPALSALIEVY